MPGASRCEVLGTRALFEVPADALQPLLHFAVARSWAVTRVHPLQLSLEDTFVAAVKGSGQPVGGHLE